jgi:hypothetical protein
VTVHWHFCDSHGVKHDSATTSQNLARNREAFHYDNALQELTPHVFAGSNETAK